MNNKLQQWLSNANPVSKTLIGEDNSQFLGNAYSAQRGAIIGGAAGAGIGGAGAGLYKYLTGDKKKVLRSALLGILLGGGAGAGLGALHNVGATAGNEPMVEFLTADGRR